MTARNALVLINGAIKELPSGDTLNGATGGVGGGLTVTYADTAPVDTSVLWVNTNDLTMNVYYDDGTSAQWVNVTGAFGADGVDGTNGASGVQSAAPRVYQWAASAPATPTGSSTFVWSTFLFGAAPAGWSLTPASSPTPGHTLWVAEVTLTAAATAVTSSIPWVGATVFAAGAAGTNGTNGATGGIGPNGVDGLQNASPRVYQWAASLPSAPSGSATFVWATFLFGAAPAGWSLTPGTSPTPGHTLWVAEVSLTALASVVSSNITWSTATVFAGGAAGTNGSNGTNGTNGAPSGNTGEVQYNNAGAWAGAANVEINNGDLNIVVNTSPVTPPAGSVKLFSKSLGNTRVMPAAVGPSGMDYVLQPSMWRQKISRWNAAGNGTGVPGVDGFAAWTAVGTATARAVATTNLMTRMRRLGYVSAATVGSLLSVRTAAAQYTTGNGSGLGGFFMSMRLSRSDAAAVAGARFFAGMTATTGAPTNVEPSTLVNTIGIAQLSTAADRLYLVYGGSAAQTAIDLTTAFPPYNGTVGLTTGVPYDFTLWCPPNSNGVVNWQLDRLDTGTSTGGTITPGTPGTQTPANTTLLNPVIWACNNATALAVGVDISNVYLETDY